MTPAKLRQIMRDLELNAAQMARLVGVERSTVSRWLAGTRKIRGPTALLLEGYQRAKGSKR